MGADVCGDTLDDEVPCLLVSPSGVTVLSDKVQDGFRLLRRAGVVAVLPQQRRQVFRLHILQGLGRWVGLPKGQRRLSGQVGEKLLVAGVVAGELAVKLVSEGGERLQGLSEESIARELSQARRDLGVKYKELTPPELREYIYEVNTGRYKDPLGPKFEDLVKRYDGDYTKIIEAAQRPNPNVDNLLGGFKEWLIKKNGL